MSRRLSALAALVLVPVAAACAESVATAVAEPPKPGACTTKLTREVLERSLALGTRFLLTSQRPEGNFAYLYDWQSKGYRPGDNQVRQAGALWGLTLVDQARPDPRVDAAVERGLEFFLKNTHAAEDGSRFVVYPGDPRGATGTVALLALAFTDYLRCCGEQLAAPRASELRGALDGYLRFLLRARSEDGRWHADYRPADGTPFGPSSSYSDGEALLALVKAARYLGRGDLREPVLAAADAGYRLNVAQALAANPDSDVTKGYYQWSSMAFYELAVSGWPGTAKYADYVLQLADWMVDVHRTLDRTRNTGYAYEGIIHAYRLAVEGRLTERARKYSCVIDQGLEKLTSWQVGSPIALPAIAAAAEDPRALGGVQNHEREPGLRVDVAQHQMHAVVLALRWVYVD